MAPLKQGSRDVGVYLGIRDLWGGVKEEYEV